MPNLRLVPSGAEVPVTNVFVIGKNYLPDAQAKAAQREQPLIVCMKPTSALLVEPQKIELPDFSKEVHFEIELVLLIGKDGRCVDEARALDYVMGYGVGLDLTAFDLQQQAQQSGLPWMRCKGFAGAAPLSGFVESHRLEQPDQAMFALRVNGELRQDGYAGDMVYSIAQVVSRLSDICPLTRGDIIFTGTPAGAGPLNSGDQLELDLMGLVQARFEVA